MKSILRRCVSVGIIGAFFLFTVMMILTYLYPGLDYCVSALKDGGAESVDSCYLIVPHKTGSDTEHRINRQYVSAFFDSCKLCEPTNAAYYLEHYGLGEEIGCRICFKGHGRCFANLYYQREGRIEWVEIFETFSFGNSVTIITQLTNSAQGDLIESAFHGIDCLKDNNFNDPSVASLVVK